MKRTFQVRCFLKNVRKKEDKNPFPLHLYVTTQFFEKNLKNIFLIILVSKNASVKSNPGRSSNGESVSLRSGRSMVQIPEKVKLIREF